MYNCKPKCTAAEHIVNTIFFFKSKCCWTYRTVAPRQSKCFNENTHILSFDSSEKTQISVTYKAVTNVQQQ